MLLKLREPHGLLRRIVAAAAAAHERVCHERGGAREAHSDDIQQEAAGGFSGTALSCRLHLSVMPSDPRGGAIRGRWPPGGTNERSA